MNALACKKRANRRNCLRKSIYTYCQEAHLGMSVNSVGDIFIGMLQNIMYSPRITKKLLSRLPHCIVHVIIYAMNNSFGIN